MCTFLDSSCHLKNMDLKCLSSSSHFSEDICSSKERQVGLWEADKHPKFFVSEKSIASSFMERLMSVEYQTANYFEHPESFLPQDRKPNHGVNGLALGTSSTSSHSLTSLSHVVSDQGTTCSLNTHPLSNFLEGNKVDLNGTQYERSLFSSSLSELFSRKLRLSANNDLYGHSVDTVASHYEEEELFESLEELEAKTIGNLLPNDDDLCSGLTVGFDHLIHDNGGDDMEEVDIFSSVGGLDLGDDISSSGQKNSEFAGAACDGQLGACSGPAAGEHPSGTLFARNINCNSEDSGQKHIEVRDVRAAEAALGALNGSDIAGKRIKVEPGRPGAAKQCVVQQIRPGLEQEKYNFYMNQRSPPLKSPTSFPGPGFLGIITSGAMDAGRVLGVEPVMRSSSLQTANTHRTPTSLPNTVPSLVRVKSLGNHCGIITESDSHGQLNDIQSASTFHPHSLLEHHDGLTNVARFNSPEVAANNLKTQERMDNMQFCQVNSNRNSMGLNEHVFKCAGSGSYPLHGQNYKWSNSYHPPSLQPSRMMWPNPPTYASGICAACPMPRLHGPLRSPSHVMGTVLPINNHHVGSAPAVNPPFWDKQHAYAGKSPETSGFRPGSLGNVQFSNNTPHCVDLVSHNMFPHIGGKCIDLPIPLKNQRCMMYPDRNHMVPMINAFDTQSDRARNRRNESGSNQADNKKQYELDIDGIERGEDNRTTLMIKNIPNKYTSKMLLAAIDERHKGTYDFIYLPIDFKNKCNVGYAFINMTSPSLIIPFYQTFNGKKWEKFNSEKVASLAYGRIQGKAALIAHFQNSSLMNEDKRCRPILFNTDGPNAGDQVPFPMGVNVRHRPARGRSNTQADNPQGSPPTSGNSEISSEGGPIILKESD